MKLLQRTLLAIFLCPALFLLVISAANLKEKTSIKIFNFKSLEMPIGIWILLGTTSGAILGTYGVRNSLEKQQEKLYDAKSNFNFEPHYIEDYNNEEIEFDEDSSHQFDQMVSDYQPLPERDIKDPPPTLSVPFRVIKKGTIENYSRSKIYEEDDMVSSQSNERQAEFTPNTTNEDWHCNVADSW